MRCGRAGRRGCWGVWSRRHPPWGPSCGVSGGGHARQLDRVSRELLARAWAAGAGPGDGPLTIDLDSTLCETYGLCKEGARHHGYTGQRGYHPILAVAAGTGDVLMACVRAAPTRPEAPPTSWGDGGPGAPCRSHRTTHHGADSGFYTHAIVAVPKDEGPFLHHRPPAPRPAQPHRGHTRGGLDAHTLLDGGLGRDCIHPLPE